MWYRHPETLYTLVDLQYVAATSVTVWCFNITFKMRSPSPSLGFVLDIPKRNPLIRTARNLYVKHR